MAAILPEMARATLSECPTCHLPVLTPEKAGGETTHITVERYYEGRLRREKIVHTGAPRNKQGHGETTNSKSTTNTPETPDSSKQ
ncbi:hypothetical protein PtB15_17B142 [Puccinia triticina]|nr:hypothetical protein PtB15_17B142 [Puccinia triticina]